MSEVTHQLPPDGAGGIMPCCGRTPFEAPRTDRMTEDPTLVTCIGEVSRALVEKGAEALRGVQESWGESLPASETRMRARAVLGAVLPEIRAQALQAAADAWQTGQWADAPRSRDRVQERIANAQFVTDWLRDRAAREVGDRP